MAALKTGIQKRVGVVKSGLGVIRIPATVIETPSRPEGQNIFMFKRRAGNRRFWGGGPDGPKNRRFPARLLKSKIWDLLAKVPKPCVSLWVMLELVMNPCDCHLNSK